MNYAVEHLTLPVFIKELGVNYLINYDRVRVLTIAHDFLFDNDCAGPFSHLKSLREFRVMNNNLRVYVEEGILYTDDVTWLYDEPEFPRGKILLAVPPAYPTDHFVVPNGVTFIYKGALNGCRFKTITLPDSLDEIDFYAISEIEGLECIRVPNKKILIQDQDWLTNVKYESKDGCALDKEVCEVWDFWTTPRDFYFFNLNDKIGSKSLDRIYSFSRNYVYPSNDMHKTIENIKTWEDWTRFLETVDNQYGDYSEFMRAMLFIEVNPNFIGCDRDEDALRVIRAIWGDSIKAKEYVLKYVDLEYIKCRCNSFSYWEKYDYDNEFYNDILKLSYEEYEQLFYNNDNLVLENQNLFIASQLATSAPMLFLDYIGKRFIKEKVFIPLAVKALYDLSIEGNIYAISNFLAISSDRFMFSLEYPKEIDLKKVRLKAVEYMDLHSVYEVLKNKIAQLDDRAKVIRTGCLLEIERLVEQCLNKNAFTECLDSKSIEQIKFYAQNEMQWIKNNFKVV